MDYGIKVFVAFLIGLLLVLVIGSFNEASTDVRGTVKNQQMERLIRAEEQQARSLGEIVRILRSRR